MRQRLLARLLHYANASPPMMRAEFYALKERLLRKYGTLDGGDVQEIRKECWGPRAWRDEWGDYDYRGCSKDCTRCGGTGVFDIRWVWLERWRWGKYVFHRPAGETRIPNDAPITIRGRIQHPDYGRGSNEAALWLYLLCGEWRLLWRSIRGSCCCGRYWWPFLNVQRVLFKVRMKLGRQKCWCGRRFFHWGTGWQVCKRCRKERTTADIPF